MSEEIVWLEPSRARAENESPEDYVRTLGKCGETARAAYQSLIGESLEEKQLAPAKEFWLNLRRVEEVEYRHECGHSRAMTDHWLRRRSRLSVKEITTSLVKHDWSEQK